MWSTESIEKMRGGRRRGNERLRLVWLFSSEIGSDCRWGRPGWTIVSRIGFHRSLAMGSTEIVFFQGVRSTGAQQSVDPRLTDRLIHQVCSNSPLSVRSIVTWHCLGRNNMIRSSRQTISDTDFSAVVRTYLGHMPLPVTTRAPHRSGQRRSRVF